MPHEVFVSYRNEDQQAAERLCSELEGRGIGCWMAPRNIPIGTEWPTAIVQAIAASKVFVLVLSSHSVSAKQISREAELADKQGCQIITFRIEDVQPPPGLSYFLGNIQWLDAFGDKFTSAVAQLAQLISKAPETSVPQPGPSAAALVAPVSATRPPWLVPAIGIGIVLIALLVWLVAHPKPVPVPTPVNDMDQAKAVADRFLDERESGNLDAAWAETGPEFQNKVNKSAWLKTQAQLKEHGRVTNKFVGCKAAGSGFICGYSLAFSDQTTARNTIGVMKQPDGSWKVDRAEIKEVPKS